MHWLIIGGQERRWCSTAAMTGVRARRHREQREESQEGEEELSFLSNRQEEVLWQLMWEQDVMMWRCLEETRNMILASIQSIRGSTIFTCYIHNIITKESHIH